MKSSSEILYTCSLSSIWFTIISSQGMTHLFIFLTVSFSGQKFLILINLILTDNLILNNLILIKSNLFFIHGICFRHCSWKFTTKSNISPISSRYVRIVLYRNRELTTLSSYSLFLIIFIFLKYAFP